MIRKLSLSDAQRGQIVILHNEGYSERLICERVRRCKNAVHSEIMKFKKTGTYSKARRCGRFRKTTPRDDHVIRRTAVRSPLCSTSKIRCVLFAKGADVSRIAVSRRLFDGFQLKIQKPAKKPRLTAAMEVKHLSFAKKHAKLSCQIR